MRGTGSWDVVFDDVFVPELMAQVGTPWEQWDRGTERMLSWFACTVAAVYLGIADAATNAAVAAVDRCFRMVGGSAVYRRLPIERMFRDVQAGPLHPPTNDLAIEGLGHAALGIPPDAVPRWGDSMHQAEGGELVRSPRASSSTSQMMRSARTRAAGRS